MSEERLARIEAALAGLATKADLEVAVATAAAGLATKADLDGVAKNVDVTALGRALERQTTEIATLKDDMNVMAAIVTRLDNSHSRLLEEIRATHAQVTRLANRVGQLHDRVDAIEDQQP